MGVRFIGVEVGEFGQLEAAVVEYAGEEFALFSEDEAALLVEVGPIDMLK